MVKAMKKYGHYINKEIAQKFKRNCEKLNKSQGSVMRTIIAKYNEEYRNKEDL